MKLRSKLDSSTEIKKSFEFFAETFLVLKFIYSEKATKIWNNLPLWRYWVKTTVMSKQVGDFFQILWPSHNIWTLPCQDSSWQLAENSSVRYLKLCDFTEKRLSVKLIRNLTFFEKMNPNSKLAFWFWNLDWFFF